MCVCVSVCVCVCVCVHAHVYACVCVLFMIVLLLQVLKNTDGSETSLIKDSKMGGAPNSKATPTSCNDVPLEINTTAMLAEKEHILAQKEVEVRK